jgi:sulfide:quinone oxidoreductase
MKSHHQIIIIGGGTAGIMVASQMLRQNKSLDIAIVEPAETHYYQPAWTLVGGGTYDFSKTSKPMASLIPKGATWIQDYATGFAPEANTLHTQGSGDLTYDYLVVAPGLVMEPSMIEGLPEALDKGIAVSTYVNPEKVCDTIRNFDGGNALFTQPTTPIKCGGAPQKIAYLAADHFRRRGVADKTNVIFATPGSVIFGVKPIRDTLEKVLDRYNMHFKPFYAPQRIDVENKVVHFNHTAPEENRCVINEGNALGETMTGDVDISVRFDMLHLAPPQAAPKFIRESVLANDAGWLEVDQYTMQHKRYSNIFGLGDVAGLPTAKTGAPIRKQVPALIDNLKLVMREKAANGKQYNGYSSCPLVTGYGKMVLAEFDYDGNFIPDPKLRQMLVFNSDKEHWRLWMLKKYGLPYLYWNKMMKGQDV